MTPRIYTSELLRIMYGAKPSDICAFPGCNQPRYNGRRRNNYNCCNWHRYRIMKSQNNEQTKYIKVITESGLNNEVASLPYKQENPSQWINLPCSLCGIPFKKRKRTYTQIKRRGGKWIFCKDCWESRKKECVNIYKFSKFTFPEKILTLTCQFCKNSFIREKNRHFMQRKRGNKNFFCPDCWTYKRTDCHRISQPPKPPKVVNLQCSLCKKVFIKNASKYKGKKRRGNKNFFCPECVRYRYSECHKFVKPLQILSVKCKICGNVFEDAAYIVRERKKKGCINNFCPNYHELKRCTRSIILKSMLCQKLFERLKCSIKKQVRKHGMTSSFCCDCWRNRISECQKIAQRKN